MPEVIGGLYSIQSKIKYPEIAKRAGIEGKVYVQAFIDEDGNVANAKIIKGIGGGCDETALDAVKQTKFKPGRQRGTPVKVQVSIPIVFKLQ
jgi:protein TonB